MSNWTGFDFLIFLIFAANTLLGMSRGATREIISTISLCVALIIAIKFTIPLTNFFNSSPLAVDVVTSRNVQYPLEVLGLPPLTGNMLNQFFYAISLLVCFVGTFSICESALAATGVMEMYTFPFAALNRKLGATLGCVRGYVVNLLVISIFTLHLFSQSSTSFFSNSVFLNLLQSSAVSFDSIISGQNPDYYQQIFQNKNLYPAAQILNNIASPALGGSGTIFNPTNSPMPTPTPTPAPAPAQSGTSTTTPTTPTTTPTTP